MLREQPAVQPDLPGASPWGEGSDVAVCRVGGFGAGGCACGCASGLAGNEENVTCYWKRKGLLQGCETLCWGKKCRIAGEQEGAVPEPAAGLEVFFLPGAQVEFQGFGVSLDFCPRVPRLEGYVPASPFGMTMGNFACPMGRT